MEGNTATQQSGPIGIFDSGLGGLTILDGIRRKMSQYDFIYLGDNARAPYGTRSFDVVYKFTLQAVKKLFSMGCPLVILACNTASAKALRSIQQKYLPKAFPNRRVLGVIRPTAEVVGMFTKSNHIGILATEGTVRSESYKLEIQKLYPATTIVGQACPMWVPLVENGEYDKPGADYFIQDSINKLLTTDSLIDTIILGCTHYPLLLPKIKQYTPKGITLVPQGKYIAKSLQDYLQRHQEMEHSITKGGTCQYFTTESSEKFSESASIFLNESIEAVHITL